LRGYKTKSSVSATSFYLNISSPADNLDWRSKNGVTSVKNQMMCGADWALAVTAYAESKLIIDGK
jgi:C1A family cysteine protease